ncbi:DNA-directed RNA polymerase subunit beta [Candidatus Aerophobetes bacterium]|nr:DNA-directed RNA polymerase subunit beta [Candidatus Aerophobetes bacterium]
MEVALKEKKKVREFSKYSSLMEIPDLLETQRSSYQEFLQQDVTPEKREYKGLEVVFRDIFPVESYNGKISLEYGGYRFAEPRYSPEETEEKELTYAIPLYVKLRLNKKETGEVIEQEVYLGDIPLMNERGSFIINGTEKVVVSQIQRTPGVFFEETATISNEGKALYRARIIPERGNWLDLEFKDDFLYMRINRGRRFPATLFLRAFGASPEGVLKQIEHTTDREILKNTFEQDSAESTKDALLKIYHQLRPGRPPVFESVKEVFERTFLNPRYYNLGKVGRFQIDQELGLDTGCHLMVLRLQDLIGVVKRLLQINREITQIESIDHLAYRRVRGIGKLLGEQIRIGLAHLSRIVQQRMSIQPPETITPRSLVNTRALRGAVQSFFYTGQLCQYLDQTNPLSELTHKRRLSALGPGGLSRVQAKEEVRDIHYTHYGRICPIETPEGQNIGLITSLAIYARVNEFGFLEAPYRKVKDGIATKEVEYLSAREEDKYYIAGCNAVDKKGRFIKPLVIARYRGEILAVPTEKINYIDISPKQIVSVSASLTPFLEHNDANRALMGSNMQRQAIHLENPEEPLVQTGMEGKVAEDSRIALRAKRDGEVIYVDASKIMVKHPAGIDTYPLVRFKRSNQRTCIDQRPIVKKGEKVKKGDFITDGPTIRNGKLALGRNVLVAFMPWEGYNFEDAIVVSEKFVKEDFFTSIHIEEFQVEAKDLRSGVEEITSDIPNVDETALRNLDEKGITRIGAEVSAGDILVGKVTPQVEVKLTPEERLLRSIFGEKAQRVKDNSLRVPHGIEGKVIKVKVFSRERGDDLSPDVRDRVKVYVAVRRKIGVGDKMAGRHGNKGVVAKIVPEEDMPCLPDGTPVEVVLNPLGVPSRMNVGQIFELHLGWVAKKMDAIMVTPVFEGPKHEEVRSLLKEADLPEDGKIILYDARTGEPFDRPVAVGYMYMMKLVHIAEEKLHSRSTGPYALITQQPLGGRSRQGGQRFGEMEVWALEGYGAAYTLQEMLTSKSDDLLARTKMHEKIIKGENTLETETPESLKVLVKEFQSLGLSLEFWKNGKRYSIKDMEKEGENEE